MSNTSNFTNNIATTIAGVILVRTDSFFTLFNDNFIGNKAFTTSSVI